MLSGLLPVSASLKLCQISVVVALHLQVKDLALTSGRRGDQVVIQELQNASANFAQLLLHLA